MTNQGTLASIKPAELMDEFGRKQGKQKAIEQLAEFIHAHPEAKHTALLKKAEQIHDANADALVGNTAVVTIASGLGVGLVGFLAGMVGGEFGGRTPETLSALQHMVETFSGIGLSGICGGIVVNTLSTPISNVLKHLGNGDKELKQAEALVAKMAGVEINPQHVKAEGLAKEHTQQMPTPTPDQLARAASAVANVPVLGSGDKVIAPASGVKPQGKEGATIS